MNCTIIYKLHTCIVTISGTASAPMASVRSDSLSSLAVDMTAPVYGRECVDSYRATAVVGGMTVGPIVQRVVNPTQDMFTLVIPGVDLCRNTFTYVTAYGVTDGMEGAIATPVTVDNIDRTSKLKISQSSCMKLSSLFNCCSNNYKLISAVHSNLHYLWC